MQHTIILNWKGPFTLDEVLANKQRSNGLYIITGKRKNERFLDIQYCGITEGSFHNRIKKHQKVPLVTREREFWLANVEYPIKVTRTFLEKAESIIIYFWQPNLNTRKKVYPPTPITLINKWYKKDGGPRLRQHKIMKNLDDVLCWDGEFWRTGNLSIYSN
ncbi:hypothetical protein ACG9XW_16810 [Acinetobacter guillouiae]